jgi:RimJ/RimL family protein N-acetyltransferase
VRIRRAEAALGLRQHPAIDVEQLLGLRLRTPRLELRLPVEEELMALARIAEQGIHPPETMPFRIPWTDSAGSPGFMDDFVAFHLGARERWQPESWSLLLGVWLGGEAIGVQDVRGENFAVERRFETGSWLRRSFQGRGLGTEMRHGILHLGFAGLGARIAVSGAFEDNAASARVSEKLRYVVAGEAVFEPRGVPQRELIFTLERDRWTAQPHPPVEIVGLEPCRPLFGLS